MVIGINGFEAVIPRFGYDKKTGLPNRVGSGQYCYELLISLHEIDKENNYIIYLPQDPTSDLPRESDSWHYKIIKGRTLWTLIALSRKLFFDKEKPDVFFSPTHYLPLYVPCPSVMSILDVSYLHFPKLFKKRDLYQLKLWGRYSIGKAKKIITISNSTKNDIIKAYGIDSGKIEVIYPGIKQGLMINDKGLTVSDLSKKFGID